MAKREISRTDFSNPKLDAATQAQIAAAAPVLKASGSLSAGADLDHAQAELFDTRISASRTAWATS